MRFYLGIPGGGAGGTRAGLDVVSDAPWFASPVTPGCPGGGLGREGTGGAPTAVEGLGPKVATLTAGGRLGGGAVTEAGRDPGGLFWKGDFKITGHKLKIKNE